MDSSLGSTPGSPSDTLLAKVLEEYECDQVAVLRRIQAMDPALARRVMELVDGLRAGGLLHDPVKVGRFILEESLGRGAMGIVWKARDPALGRDVAVKVLAGHLLARPIAVERFGREARIIGSLRHPGIVTVYEVGESEGVPYLAMELVDGGSLGQRLADAHGARLEQPEICRLGMVLCEALQAAHDAGVVHRDVKPSNVLLRSSGAPLLGDFGLACVDGDPSLTATGDFLGTPAYAAPELLESGQADARSDVYSLGATLFHAMAGRPPFDEGSVQALIRRVTSGDPPRLRSLHPGASVELESVLDRALAKEPGRRFQTAREFGEDLGRIVRGEPVRARRVRTLHRVVRWARRRPALATAIFVPLAWTIAFTIGFVWWQGVQLQRYEQLADVRVVDSLRAEVPVLWPALPTTVPRMDRWLGRARGVLSRAERHRQEKQRLASLSTGVADGVPRFDDDATAWQYGVLDSLGGEIEKLVPLVPIIENRRDAALTVEDLTITGPEARRIWAVAADAIRASPRYGGLELHPQLGLLPLGEDPRSGLWEFWHPLTGARPEPSTSGSPSRWRITPETGMVFVLVPAGLYTIGARPPSAEFSAGTPFVDPGPFKLPTKVDGVQLRPYFLAKYEVTQSQWERLTGTAPSQYDHRRRSDLCTPTCPVESVSWEDVHQLVAHAQLSLPTDVQWEVAYRAGSTTIFPAGDAAESMYGTENVLDQSWARAEGRPPTDAAPCDDGFPALAPVGSYQANAFGLHDMGGNVAEICADDVTSGEFSPRVGDGLMGQAAEGRYRLVRGASWADDFGRARSGYREVTLKDRRTSMVGVRLARVVTE